MTAHSHDVDPFGAGRRPALTQRIVRRLKGDPSTAASAATQHATQALMHVPIAIGYLAFVHPAHHALLVRWLPGGAYLLVIFGYLGAAWQARGGPADPPSTSADARVLRGSTAASPRSRGTAEHCSDGAVTASLGE